MIDKQNEFLNNNISDEMNNHTNGIKNETNKESKKTDNIAYKIMTEGLGKTASIPTINNPLHSIPQHSLINPIKLGIAEPKYTISSMIESLVDSQNHLSIMPYYQGLSSSLTNCCLPILGKNQPSMSGSITNLITSYKFDLKPPKNLSIYHLLETIDFTPMYILFENFKGFDYKKNHEKLKKMALKESLELNWFPHVFCIDDVELILEFWNILAETKKSKNRIKRMDSLIFKKYTKKKIEEIRKSWRQKEIPNHLRRMMNQAVYSFHRKEYALTVVMLTTLWEGIIYDKVNDNRKKNGNRTIENFSDLIKETGHDRVFSEFFDKSIMYTCYSKDEVKEDVPGRNSIAHGWYRKYPSRKAALNAIMFTDFLVKLKPLEEV